MNRDYDDYMENKCIPIGATDFDKTYIFGQSTVDKLLDDLDWYKMWHKIHMAEIEKLRTELETYRPTKLDGNGQCSCYGCEQKKDLIEFGLAFVTDIKDAYIVKIA